MVLSLALTHESHPVRIILTSLFVLTLRIYNAYYNPLLLEIIEREDLEFVFGSIGVGFNADKSSNGIAI